ncbi:hypothetical protein C8J57DRAFT_1724736 [Mycena rebaudengoi]|nr:hypothetical protein C8J57DRAFT_1724736 [Mycena rebaudengoi]
MTLIGAFMATPSIGVTPAVAPAHVRPLLSHEVDTFYLDIPISVVTANCLRPIKYLRFIGWCVIGILGTVNAARDGQEIAHNAHIQDQAIYYYTYTAAPNGAPQYAVDLEAANMRSNVSSSSSSRVDEFRVKLIQRDAACIFTDAPSTVCIGSHIIPFHKGDEWFDLIVKSRLAGDEDVHSLNTINDFRNGMLLAFEQHHLFDRRQLVVLKTPNLVLAMDDIPPRPARTVGDISKYPDGQRYTLQWLEGEDDLRARTANNSDAAFRKHTHILKPSPLLLFYNYGVAAVKWWGHGKEHLGITNRPTIPRPIAPIPSAMGPTRARRTKEELKASREKRASNSGGAAAGSGVEPRDGDQVMDPDEVVMYFWSRTPAALQRRREVEELRQHEAEERALRLEQWRGDLVST